MDGNNKMLTAIVALLFMGFNAGCGNYSKCTTTLVNQEKMNITGFAQMKLAKLKNIYWRFK